jgi:hypothetical protein
MGIEGRFVVDALLFYISSFLRFSFGGIALLVPCNHLVGIM